MGLGKPFWDDMESGFEWLSLIKMFLSRLLFTVFGGSGLWVEIDDGVVFGLSA